MAAQTAAQEDPVAGLAGAQGAGRAGPYAFAAGKAGFDVYFRTFIIQGLQPAPGRHPRRLHIVNRVRR